MTTNEKIQHILKKHEGGKEFFDALDAMVRGDSQILTQFIEFVKKEYISTEGIILSGEFGRALINNHLADLFDISNNIILTNGGLREGRKVEFYKNKIVHGNSYEWVPTYYIFLDDSIYSGRTSNIINEELGRMSEGNAKLSGIYVVYDGSKKKVGTVKSLFRYHK